jgi:transposase
MRIYSDSKVSDFLNSLTIDQSIAFQNAWNENHDHREKIYISYDSTNKNCDAGDVEFVEYGHPKDDQGAPVVNYSIAYDTQNAVPLFYEDYPGSIVDITQLQYMLEKAKGYGYKKAGFILDRGYFSKENIHFMDRCGYDFVIMMKGMKDLVRELVLEVKGTFEEDRRYSIRDYKVSGTTVRRQLYPSDKKERYFHIYYNERKKGSEREKFESKIDQMAEVLRKYEGTKHRPQGTFNKYFDIIYHHEGTPDEKFMYGREQYDVINEDIKLCGYFVIITSEEMTAAEALDLNKGRDASEKLFRGDKSYLGNRSFRTHTNESTQAKIFVEFVALIIRNRLHTYLRKHRIANGKRQNYMNVPAAIRELEKIEMVCLHDQNYHLAHAVTATQKEILKAVGMTAASIRSQAVGINEDLAGARSMEV